MHLRCTGCIVGRLCVPEKDTPCLCNESNEKHLSGLTSYDFYAMILWWLEEGYAHVFMFQFQEKSSLWFWKLYYKCAVDAQ